MDAHLLDEIDAEVICERLAEARHARGMTQQQTSEALGIARTTVVAIEKGDRRPRASELAKLAQLYGRSVGSFVQAPPRTGALSFIEQFRAAHSTARVDADIDRNADINRFEMLCRWYVELEEMLGAPLPRRYPESYDISGTPPERAAEEVAASERNRLGLGDGPIAGLWSVLESDVGLRLFSFPMNDRTVAGLYVHADDFGGCVAINSNHPEERQRLSGAQEYAHFLTSRHRPEITMLKKRPDQSASERFAEAFARQFLMPASSLIRRFEGIRRTKRTAITPADVLMLSRQYRVSAQAMTLRLEELRLLPNGTWDLLKELGRGPHEASEFPNHDAAHDGLPRLPTRYVTLAVQAYEQDLLTEGQLAERLETDRLGARDRIRESTAQRQLSEDGELRRMSFDLSLPLVKTA